MATAAHSTPSGVIEPGLPRSRRAREPFDPARLRLRIEHAVDRLIAALDALDAPAADLEPSFGYLPDGAVLDECEPDPDDEETCEDEGADIQAQPHDGEADEEPTLGAPENPHDQTRWAQGNAVDECEIGEDELPASYVPVENSIANQAVAARAERALKAIVARKRGAPPSAQSDVDLRPFPHLLTVTRGSTSLL